MAIYIIGAGMAGLLAANMLRRHDPVILEAQPSLPNNHGSVLRFGSNIVSDVLGIPFRKVNLIKSTLPWSNPVADAMAYSKKNLGTYQSDRSISKAITSTERWIAPEDLIQQMARGVYISFGNVFNFDKSKDKVISTIPMPSLMRLLNYPLAEEIEFKYFHGVNVTATVKNCDAFVTLNIPDPGVPYSRVSITGDKLIVEFPNSFLEYDDQDDFLNNAREAASKLGVSENDLFEMKVSNQAYHKIAPIDEGERKEFIHWASVTKGAAWQLGRFATWRPGLQLDDLVKDIRLIERWMTTKSNYEMEMHRGAAAG